MRVSRLPLKAAVALLLLSSCSSKPPTAPVSKEGREICRERSAQEVTSQAARSSFSLCLRSIEAELAALRQEQQERVKQQQQSQADQPAPPTPAERYLHCRRVQQQVIDNERRRLVVQPRLILAASRSSPNEETYRQAQRDYDDVMATFERLIPPPMRGELPMIPDAVKQFQACDRDTFLKP